MHGSHIHKHAHTHTHTHRIVKLSSPYLNVLIIAGAIIFYVEVILLGVDENVASYDTVDALCQVPYCPKLAPMGAWST